MSQFTFEQLPQAMDQVLDTLAELKDLIIKSLENPEEPKDDSSMDINELRAYLPDHPAKSTIYGWVGQGLIPYHKYSKKLSFKKAEIDAWLEKGFGATAEEVEDMAIDYVNRMRI